jgi:murein L,D-transpeptidase YafK
MRRFALAPLVLLSALGGASAQVPTATLALPVLDYIRVEKAARRMDLFADGRLVHTIQRIQLGEVPVGPKQFEGDERTPEGRYVVDWGNPESAYHLSLHISYPNAQDTAHAEAMGQGPGGMIMIHGQPNSLASGRVPGDWTDGCIAVSNDEIEALWDAVPEGTVIDILP